MKVIRQYHTASRMNYIIVLPHLSNQDILFIVWDILMSVLTIKHIGGIVFVAESIAKIITRFTKMVGVNDFLASLPGLFVDILLDEENINNRNFILRRSTGFSKAICSVFTTFISSNEIVIYSLSRVHLF